MYFPIHPENFMQKYYLHQKLLAILVFCLFKQNCRLFFDSTGDSASERLQKSLKIWLKIFDFFSIRKFGIVDKGSDCDAQGPGFESSLRCNFKVSRLYKWQDCHIFSRAHKSVNFNISKLFFLLKFITQSYVKIDRNSKQIVFLVNYTTL